MNTTLDSVNIYQYTDHSLKALYQNNEQFNIELNTIQNFYYGILNSFVNEEDKSRLQEDLYNSINGQIFNGYFMIQELFQNPEVTISNDWFKQTIGMMEQQLPTLLKDAIGDSYEEVITEQSFRNLTGWLVSRYEGIYPLLMDISLNSACLGAKWAFISESKKRELTLANPSTRGFLGYIDDVSFICPQYYIQCHSFNEGSEVWDILNSRMRNIEKVGEVVVLKSTQFNLHLYINTHLDEQSQQTLIDTIITRLVTLNQIELTQLKVSIALIEDYYEINLD